MDIHAVRAQFPILSRQVYGRPLIYLDNAATTQLPRPVWQAMERYYLENHANVHRGSHYLSETATAQLEQVRRSAAAFLGAESDDGILFTSGTTEGINLLARSMEPLISSGDRILVTAMEHHSNFLPWQELCRRTGARFHVVPLTSAGEPDPEELRRLLALPGVRLLAVTAVSNVLGTQNPVPALAQAAHAAGAWIFVDGAQDLRHGRLDMKALDCDAFAFSGHKMMAPTGTGVLYVRASLLSRLSPSSFGGGMVDRVSRESSSYAGAPGGFEAGTPNIAGIIGLGAAIDYLTALGPEDIARREAALLSRAEEGLRELKGVTVYGAPKHRAGALSFNLEGVHPYDAAGLLDRLGIALRAGHHCAQPLMEHLGVTGTLRVSPAFYNTGEEIDVFLEGVQKVQEVTRPYHA